MAESTGCGTVAGRQAPDGVALSEPASLAQSDGAGTGGVAATHQPAPKPYTPAGVDWARESKSARVVQLFQVGVSAKVLPPPQPLRAATIGAALATAQPARLASAAGC